MSAGSDCSNFDITASSGSLCSITFSYVIVKLSYQVSWQIQDCSKYLDTKPISISSTFTTNQIGVAITPSQPDESTAVCQISYCVEYAGKCNSNEAMDSYFSVNSQAVVTMTLHAPTAGPYNFVLVKRVTQMGSSTVLHSLSSPFSITVTCGNSAINTPGAVSPAERWIFGKNSSSNVFAEVGLFSMVITSSACELTTVLTSIVPNNNGTLTVFNNKLKIQINDTYPAESYTVTLTASDNNPSVQTVQSFTFTIKVDYCEHALNTIQLPSPVTFLVMAPGSL